MRKPIAALISIFIILSFLALIPFIDGYIFKQHFLNFMNALKKDNQSNVQVVEYHLGWFSSDAKLSISSGNEPTGMMVNQHVAHGPFVYDTAQNQWTFALATIQDQVFLPEPFNTQLLGAHASEGIFTAYAIATFGGNYIYHVSMPLLTTILPDGSKFSWQGMNGQSYFYVSGQDIKQMKANFTLGGISLQSLRGTLTTQGAAIQYDFTRRPIGLWAGSYSFNLPGLAVTSPDQGNLSLKNLNITDLFDVDANNFYSNQFQLSLTKMMASDFAVNAGNVKLSVNKISAEGLKNVISAISKLNKTTIQPDQYNQMLQMLAGLITPATTVNENISMNTPYGNLISDGQANWPVAVKTLDDVQSNASFKVTIRASASLVNQLIAVTTPKRDYEADITTPKPMTGEDVLNNQINEWVKQNKLSISTGISLKDLIKTHLPATSFVMNVDNFVVRKDVPVEVAQQLKVQYVQLNIESLAKGGAPVMVAPKPVQPVLSPADEKKQQIQDWISRGYIVQDKDDLVTTITRDKGEVKINGLPLPGLG